MSYFIGSLAGLAFVMVLYVRADPSPMRFGLAVLVWLCAIAAIFLFLTMKA